MRLILIYDISNDRIRAKVATACEDYGLDRFQYSAFWGQLNRNLQEELMLLIDDLLCEGDGQVQLIPISESEWQKRLEVSCHAG